MPDRPPAGTAPAAVVFDLDGVIIDSEQAWDETRRDYVIERGGSWRPEATEKMMGMSSLEWAAYLHDELGVPDPPAQIATAVGAQLVERYDEHLPLLPHAVDAVRGLARAYRLGLASSANRPVIEHVLDLAALRDCFAVVLSSEEVERGKPEPDVYVAVCSALDVATEATVAVEDSTNGLRAALAAGTCVVALPNPHYPPPREVLDRCAHVLGSLAELTPELVAQVFGAAISRRDG